LELEELGVDLYDIQQNVTKQQVLIGKYHETVANTAKIRQETEAQVETCRSMYKSEHLKLNNAQKKGYYFVMNSEMRPHTLSCVTHKTNA
jgi:hypothetical protein